MSRNHGGERHIKSFDGGISCLQHIRSRLSASRLGGLSGSSNHLSSSFQVPYYPVAEISQLGSGQPDSEVPLAGTLPRGLARVVLVYMLEALNAPIYECERSQQWSMRGSATWAQLPISGRLPATAKVW